jgi:hypothetical protein
MDVISRLLRTTSNAGLQRAFADDPRATTWLSHNPNLEDDVWMRLWGKKPNAELARTLTEHPLTPDAIDHVIAKERRVTIVRNLLASSDLTTDQGRALLERGLTADAIDTWLRWGRVPHDLTGEVAAKAGEWRRAEFILESRHLFDQDEMLRLLHEPGLPEYVSCRAVALINHPNAGPDVTSTAKTVYTQSRAQWNLAGRWPKVLLGHSQIERLRVFRYAITRPWEEADTASELELLAQYRPGRLPRETSARVTAHMEATHPAQFSGTQQRLQGRDNTLSAMLGITPRRTDVTAVSDVPLDSANLIEDDAILVARALETSLTALTASGLHTAVTLLLDGYTGHVDTLSAACQSLGTGRLVTVTGNPNAKNPVGQQQGR